MCRNVKACAFTVLFMYLLSITCLIFIAIIDYCCDMAAWLRVICLIIMHAVTGLLGGYSMCRVFYKRHLLKFTIALYWLTYMIITFIVGGAIVLNIIMLAVMLFILMFTASIFI